MAEQGRPCTSCATTNEEDARFCEGCGASLARACATCGVEASATARFCRACGAPLDDQVQPSRATAARKTVTVMFADLAGSTSFEERVDAETAREVIGRYHDLLRLTAERNRAGVTKYIGDGFMAVWGVPEMGPDDADRAVDAAVDLQERFVDLAAGMSEGHGGELALRVAVNTGEVVVGAGDADLVGDAVNVAARLEAECPRGHVVVGEETWRSTRGRHSYDALGQVQVKGRTAPVAVYQWLGRQSEAADSAVFVGRADELQRLGAAFDDAIAARAARLVTVIGDPGVGKSRLAAEFVEARPGVRVVAARCDAEQTVALAPIVEVLRARDLDADIPLGVPERDRVLADLKGLAAGVPGSVEETFWALRRFVEVLASGDPLLIILDDLHWADTLLVDFVEHLAEWVTEVPVLVVALARPELREARPDLVGWVSEAFHLGGLGADATAELAAGVLGASRLPRELVSRLPSSTGGNPLFVRELVGMLVHDGVLVADAAGWRLTIDADAIAIPPTIHSLLASRLERLDAMDRRVLEIASVVGTDFSPAAVCALDERFGDIKATLDRLRRLELAQPTGAYIGDEPVWRFHHVLIRDVAYRRLLKSDRAELHERLAAWVEAGGASLAFDADEMMARHLDSAHRYRLDLGMHDEHTDALALRSARGYLTSARRALDRDQLVSAGTQAARGTALAAADEALHAELLLVGGEALLSAGDIAAAAPLVEDLDRIAGEALAPWAICYRCQFVVYTDPEQLLEVDARLKVAIDEFARRGDPAGLAKAYRVRAAARARLGRIGDCEVDLFEALVAARQAGDHRQITAALGAAPNAALWGPSPVPKAGGRCLDVVRMQRMTTAAPSLEATSLRCLAVLELLRGRADKARSMLADARQIVADLGLRHGLMETELFAGIIELMAGDPVAAEPHLRAALDGLGALGVGADAGQAAALLARSVLAQGRVDEADRYASESEHLAGHNLKTAIAWRAARAEILAAQSRCDEAYEEAIAMAREAVAVAAGTDLVLDHAEACLALGRVLAAAGDARAAEDARRDAEALFAAKEAEGPIARTVESAAPEAIPPNSRLAVANRASAVSERGLLALRAGDIDGVVAGYRDGHVYDDRRRLKGGPIEDRGDARAAIERACEQYNHFDGRTLAVRGERLHLLWTRWSDDAGNETTYLHVFEIGDDGLVCYEGRFDDDDFEGAYRELEKRYYTNEGAAFAEAGAVATDAIVALNDGDFDRLLAALSTPDFHVENRSRTAFPDRPAHDLRASLGELNAMMDSVRTWLSAVRWLSATWSVARVDREAVGPGGERYAWTWLLAIEIRDGLLALLCEFESDDEEAAFALAEERMRATPSRLAAANRASRAVNGVLDSVRARNAAAAVASYADRFAFDDRRRLSGGPIEDRATLLAAIEQIICHYSQFEIRSLAVRGDRLQLSWGRWSDEAGNETTHLHLVEIDDSGRLIYDSRFDDDDFEGAYRELERRYYAGEGAPFADAGAVATDFMTAFNQGDFDRVYGELTDPDMHLENRATHSVFPDRSAAEFRASVEKLNSMVASVRTWHGAVCWLSPTCAVIRQQREAVGLDGEPYAWTWVYVYEIRSGRLRWLCEFDPDDEEAAFAYAEERMRATPSRLALGNRASRAMDGLIDSVRARNASAAVEFYADRCTYDDRRRISGDPIDGRAGLRAATERILAQYTQFEMRTLAVRGERLQLSRCRWSDDSGNETTHLRVIEVGDDGLITYVGRYEDDDFEGAYRELERRYYAGEGAAFAEAGALATNYLAAYNQGDFDRLFSELSSTGMRAENRSRSAFPDRSASEVRASLEELNALVAAARMWASAVCWVSPAWSVARFEREAVGPAGEQYAWTRLMVTEISDGRMASICQFDPDDEAAAFAYAEERVRAKPSRLAVSNRASQAMDAVANAFRARNAAAAVEHYADGVILEDRRRLSGDPMADRAAMLASAERILAQYQTFEGRTLAVRGQRLQLSLSRFSDDAGNESTYLHVIEVGSEMSVDGRIIYHGRFDDDDFEGAYRELERRYYTGEGAAFAEAGDVSTESMIVFNQGDFDRMFDEFFVPGMRFENRSRSAFPDRSESEFRASFRELNAMVASVRMWFSAVRWLSPAWSVARFEREALGPEGERYAWSGLLVTEIRDGRTQSMCEFELDDEEAAFALAEERMHAIPTRLAVSNRASRAHSAVFDSLRAQNARAAVEFYSAQSIHDDRRRLPGGRVDNQATFLASAERVLLQYKRFEDRVLAVRGERLQLSWSRWSDDAGNETTYLHVIELGSDGLISYDGRFDGDDFEGAYRELERRYYAGEGAAYAGATLADSIVALNDGDLDRLLGALSIPEFRVENRSRTAFPDRPAHDLRASLGALNAMMESVRTWLSAVCWLSTTWSVARLDREAVGPGGEPYAWTWLLAIEIRDGRLALLCEFELDDEEAAFAFAEDRARS